MRVELEVAGRLRTVSLEARGAAFEVAIDGRLHTVEVAPAGDGRLSVRLPATGRQHAALVVSNGSGALDVLTGGTWVPVRLRPAGAVLHRTGQAGDGPCRVCAPMPGKVVRLHVGPGDAVSDRQGVVVIEAMKMENELRAPRAGTVREVLVAPGASVEAGTPLVVIE